MANKFLNDRLRGIYQQLLGAYEGSGPSSSNTKGRERELFVDIFLRNCLPPQFRFGSGEITDSSGRRTGQLDIVIELPFQPSFPLLGMSHERLYLLESVGVVMEVKSNAQKQWKEIEKTGKNLKTLKRSQTQSSGLSPKYFQSTELPFLGVVFNGWKKEHTLETYRKKGPCDGILQLKPLMLSYTETNNKGVFQDTIIKGECALGAIAVILSSYLTSFNQRQSDLFKYF